MEELFEFDWIDIDEFDLNIDRLREWLAFVVLKENRIVSSVSINFCSDEYLLKINNDFLKHDYYTDIITFDYSVDNQIIGDLLISIDRVRDNCNEYNEGFEKELHRVMVHGILHLCGYKDKEPHESEIMRKREDQYLAELTF